MDVLPAESKTVTCRFYFAKGDLNDFLERLATLLSGHYIEINLNSLSFLEFLEFHQLENNDDSLNKYLKRGGLPACCRQVSLPMLEHNEMPCHTTC